jgi:hypothetical protein
LRVRQGLRSKILEVIKLEQGLTRKELALKLGITYWSARYHLEVLVSKGFLRKEVFYIGRTVRRITYFYVVPVVLYRTQYAIMFYASVPRTKTPDPIAEMRVTAVSNLKGQYKLEEFERACIYTGVILAPQTYWIKQEQKVTADELDEPIDPDELEWSVPVYKRLNYCERYAVFFRSRRNEAEKWRVKNPYWWVTPDTSLPLPREGDYEYNEVYIKSLEEKKIALGVLKMRFNNERGEMESVL